MNSPYYPDRRIYLAVRSVSAKGEELSELGSLYSRVKYAKTRYNQSQPLKTHKWRQNFLEWKTIPNRKLQGLLLMFSHRMPLYEQICNGEFREAQKHHI